MESQSSDLGERAGYPPPPPPPPTRLRELDERACAAPGDPPPHRGRRTRGFDVTSRFLLLAGVRMAVHAHPPRARICHVARRHSLGGLALRPRARQAPQHLSGAEQSGSRFSSWSAALARRVLLDPHKYKARRAEWSACSSASACSAERNRPALRGASTRSGERKAKKERGGGRGGEARDAPGCRIAARRRARLTDQALQRRLRSSRSDRTVRARHRRPDPRAAGEDGQIVKQATCCPDRRPRAIQAQIARGRSCSARVGHARAEQST